MQNKGQQKSGVTLKPLTGLYLVCNILFCRNAVVHSVLINSTFRFFGKIQKCTYLIYRKLYKAKINIEMQFALFSTFTTQKEPDYTTQQILTVIFTLLSRKQGTGSGAWKS